MIFFSSLTTRSIAAAAHAAAWESLYTASMHHWKASDAAAQPTSHNRSRSRLQVRVAENPVEHGRVDVRGRAREVRHQVDVDLCVCSTHRLRMHGEQYKFEYQRYQ